MSISEPFVLPCGLELPNRLSKAAMAENVSIDGNPDAIHIKAYGEWADGGWGMVLTGNVMVNPAYTGSPGDVVAREKSDNPLKDAWKNWAAVSQRNSTPAIVQLCHPGRQSPVGSGSRSFFTKTIAPSAVKLDLGSSYFAQFVVSLVFGVPREMTISEIEIVISEFVNAAVVCHEAGFKGIELHGAHGYLLAQFLSPKSNLRTDAFGGDATRRAEIVVQIIKAVRAATSKEFCIGIKMNSVDISSKTEEGEGGLEDGLTQMGLVIAAGADFIEISGGTYEDPKMFAHAANELSTTGQEPIKASTKAREAFFLSFAATARERFPHIPLMVTGGFRTRSGMNAALNSGACDLIGIGRPAAVMPKLPKELCAAEKDDREVDLTLNPVERPWYVKYVPIKVVGFGFEGGFYGSQIRRFAKGLPTVNTRASV